MDQSLRRIDRDQSIKKFDFRFHVIAGDAGRVRLRKRSAAVEPVMLNRVADSEAERAVLKFGAILAPRIPAARRHFRHRISGTVVP
jgi:hypothetical protein